jgi:hypothetical protein
MHRRAGLAFLFGCPIACALCAVRPAPAAAANCSGVYSACINDDTLWPHAGAARFVAVGSTETIGPGQIGFGLVSSYLSRPIVLTIPSPAPPGSTQYAIDDQVNGTFLFSYGVSSRLELDMALPITFGQGGTGLGPLTGGIGLRDTAMRDMRFGFSYAVLTHAPTTSSALPSDGFGLAGRLEVSAPTGDDDQLAGEGFGVFVPSVAADYRWGPAFVGLELGARLRPTTELVGARVGTQLLSALGLGYDILPRQLLTVTAETWVLPTLVEQHDILVPEPGVIVSVPNGRYVAPAEWQVSLRSAPMHGGDVSFQAGGGGAIPFGGDTPVTTPRFRFTLGVRWAPRSPVRTPDGNGPPAAPPAPGSGAGAPTAAVDLHLGYHDVCKDAPDLVDGFRDDDGCPDEDQDKDGIPNRLDKCPLVPEDFAGLTDGCPEKK